LQYTKSVAFPVCNRMSIQTWVFHYTICSQSPV